MTNLIIIIVCTVVGVFMTRSIARRFNTPENAPRAATDYTGFVIGAGICALIFV